MPDDPLLFLRDKGRPLRANNILRAQRMAEGAISARGTFSERLKALTAEFLLQIEWAQAEAIARDRAADVGQVEGPEESKKITQQRTTSG